MKLQKSQILESTKQVLSSSSCKYNLLQKASTLLESSLHLQKVCRPFPAYIHLFKVNNRNTRKRCEICWKLTIKTSLQCQWRHSGIFIVNFEHISSLLLVLLLLMLNKKLFPEFHLVEIEKDRKKWQKDKSKVRKLPLAI